MGFNGVVEAGEGEYGVAECGCWPLREAVLVGVFGVVWPYVLPPPPPPPPLLSGSDNLTLLLTLERNFLGLEEVEERDLDALRVPLDGERF